MQDPRLQPIFCEWAERTYNISGVAEVAFSFEDARQWSEFTFEDASVTIEITFANGETTRRSDSFNAEFMAGLLGGSS